MKKPWLEHSSKWDVDWKDRPEQNFELNKPKDLKKLPKEFFYSVLGCSCFLGFILSLFSTALVK